MEEPIYGLVLFKVQRRNQTTHPKIAFEGAADAVVVTVFVRATSRYKVSSANRFSEPPTSDQARKLLYRKVRDRVGSFDNYCADPSTEQQVACSALSAIRTIEDDRRTHWVTATVPTLTVHPLGLSFTLTDMATEAGWEPRRIVVIWVAEALNLSLASGRKLLHVTLVAFAWSSRTLEKATKRLGRQRAEYDGHSLDICIHLSKAPPTANPTYEHVSRLRAFANLQGETAASKIMDRVYGTTAGISLPNGARFVRDGGRRIGIQAQRLGQEQRNAVDLGTGTLPIVDIQAAFGAGETVVGAIIAARRASDGKRVVMMASTNAAVAQFAQTLLSLTAFRHLHVLRFVYDAAAQENLTPTPVDMNQIPMSLGDEFDAEPTDDEKALCSKFKAGRSILERYIENPDLALICRRRTRRSTPSPSATSPT
ncbi:hypothetical protein ANCDUO_08772 [Ancylostoma duodenale]|uniref:Uncharacterized protein n=1 Tax=Ancylostoma duodenale TaxID=51022 RepID=A0A0C2GPI3_9BILA|nr:hypothetical protein ANCDUO_08772 [Ancylostoma duodenale]